MEKPSKTPFDDETNAADHGDDGAHEEESSIQKGKAKKNLKTALYAVGLIGLLVMMFWGQFFSTPNPKKSEKPIEISTVQADEPGSIVKAMEKRASVLLAAAPQPENTTLPGPPSGVSAQGRPATDASSYRGAPKASEVKEAQDERRAAVLASSMEPDGVDFTKQDKAPVEVAPPSQDLLDARRQSSLQEQLISAHLKGVNGGAALPPKELALTSSESFLARYAKSNDESAEVKPAHLGAPLYQGSIVRAVLLTGINSDQPGDFTARVISDVYDSISGLRLVIPKGSVLTGSHSTQVQAGQSRLLAAMRRMALPNGQTVSLAGAPASDTSGVSGLESDVNNHFFKMFGSSFIVGAISLLLPKEDQNVSIASGSGAAVTGGTVAARALQSTVETLAERSRVIRPTLTVPQGDVFTFLVAKDMLLTEYKK